MDNKYLQDLRCSYESRSLSRDELKAEPYNQFELWLNEAQQADCIEPNAMALATVDAQNKPASRMVLLKGLDHGFIFYTNYLSRKGRELADNPNASLLFWWQTLERQVRIEGRIEKIDDQLSDQYFDSRPLGSRFGAILSAQSQVVDNYAVLSSACDELKERYRDKAPIRPPYWGGYRLVPEYFEFWQGRANRIHDRFAYQKEQDNWQINRLSP